MPEYPLKASRKTVERLVQKLVEDPVRLSVLKTLATLACGEKNTRQPKAIAMPNFKKVAQVFIADALLTEVIFISVQLKNNVTMSNELIQTGA